MLRTLRALLRRSASPTSTRSIRCGPIPTFAATLDREHYARARRRARRRPAPTNFRRGETASGGFRHDRRRALIGFSGAILPRKGRRADLRASAGGWAPGLATECAGAVLIICSSRRPLRRPRPHRRPRRASVRLMERLGITFERRGRHHALDRCSTGCRPTPGAPGASSSGRLRSADEPLLRSLTPRLADFPPPPWRTAHEIDVSDHRRALRRAAPSPRGRARPGGRASGRHGGRHDSS